jgi:hypothetical protein
MHASGPTFNEVLDELVQSVTKFAKMVPKLKLTLSPKAVIVSSSARLTTLICQRLRQAGLTFREVVCIRDLGIDHDSGLRRQSKYIVSWLSKTTNKFQKIIPA